jgi:hypothetical protein
MHSVGMLSTMKFGLRDFGRSPEWIETTDQAFDASELGREYQMRFTGLEDFIREQIDRAPLASNDVRL